MSVSKPEEKHEDSIGETIMVIIQALVLALVVRTFAFQPFNIPSGSMKETLLVGDYLFVSKFSYGYSQYSFPFGIAPYLGGSVSNCQHLFISRYGPLGITLFLEQVSHLQMDVGISGVGRQEKAICALCFLVIA